MRAEARRSPDAGGRRKRSGVVLRGRRSKKEVPVLTSPYLPSLSSSPSLYSSPSHSLSHLSLFTPSLFLNPPSLSLSPLSFFNPPLFIFPPRPCLQVTSACPARAFRVLQKPRRQCHLLRGASAQRHFCRRRFHRLGNGVPPRHSQALPPGPCRGCIVHVQIYNTYIFNIVEHRAVLL